MFFSRRFIFWLCVALQGANALNAAAPYEVVYLYYAYKMEYLTVTTPGSRKIAPGCTHKPFTGPSQAPQATVDTNINLAATQQGVSGICTFREFMNHVGTSGWGRMIRRKEPKLNIQVPDTINDPLLYTLDPSADRLAAAINDPATIGRENLLTRPDHLFSVADLTAMGGQAANGWRVPWAEQIQKVSGVVESARQDMAKRLSLDPDNQVLRATVAIFQTWVDRAVENLDAVHRFRIGDQSRFLVPSQMAHASWTSSPMSSHGVIDKVPYQNIDGSASRLIRYDPTLGQVIDTVYDVVNFQDSFEAAKTAGTPLSSLQKYALRSFARTYGTVANSIEKAHRDVIDTVKFARDLHQKPIPASFFDSLGDCLSCCAVS